MRSFCRALGAGILNASGAEAPPGAPALRGWPGGLTAWLIAGLAGAAAAADEDAAAAALAPPAASSSLKAMASALNLFSTRSGGITSANESPPRSSWLWFFASFTAFAPGRCTKVPFELRLRSTQTPPEPAPRDTTQCVPL